MKCVSQWCGSSRGNEQVEAGVSFWGVCLPCRLVRVAPLASDWSTATATATGAATEDGLGGLETKRKLTETLGSVQESRMKKHLPSSTHR